jgi:hypothetical protein
MSVSIRFPLQCRSFSLQGLLLGGWLMAQGLPVLAACPETNSDRLDYDNSQTTYTLTTPNGRTTNCWLDTSDRAAITFEGATYDIAIRCSGDLTIHTNWDGFDHGIVDRNGRRRAYEAEFLGDRYECDGRGETMIKTWVYRRGNSVLNILIREHRPYRW